MAGSAQSSAGESDATRCDQRFRDRWLSRRALLLHFEVLVIAPGCIFAGWWQVTCALAGNGLSWLYSVEWPIFALIAVGGWWHLIHESPEERRARREDPTLPAPEPPRRAPERVPVVLIDRYSARIGTGLALLVVVDGALGITTMVREPFARPSGWPAFHLVSVDAAHSVLGALLAVGALAYAIVTRNARRITRMSGRIGLIGVAIAAAGGLGTVISSARLVAMLIMLLGAIVAGFGFAMPAFERLEAAEPALGAAEMAHISTRGDFDSSGPGEVRSNGDAV